MAESVEMWQSFACLLESQTVPYESLPSLVYLIDNHPYGSKSVLFLGSVLSFIFCSLSLLMLSPSQLSHADKYFLLTSVFMCTVIKLSL